MPDFIVIPALCSRSRLGLREPPSDDGGNERERRWALSYKPTQWQDLQYDELPSPNHIRLLQKHEKEDHRLFVCTLRTFHIDDAPWYTALSYTWGSPYGVTAKADNHIGEEYDYHIIVNGQIHHVSENLFLVLRRMSTQDDGWMWADQVCIDQADDEEKAIQVARMSTIYAKAAGTYACDEGKVSVSQAVTLSGQETLWTVVGVPRWGDKQVDSIVQFFNRSWFERAWTIQELALSKEVAVACGGFALDWLYFSTLSKFLFSSGLYQAMQKAKDLSLAPQTVAIFQTESGVYEIKQTIDTLAIVGSFDAQDDEELLAGSSSKSPDWPELDAFSQDAERTIPSVRDVTRAAREREQSNERTADAESLERAESFSRLYQVARSMRRIFCTSNGALGHGAEGLQDGDVVAFLVGATVLFILRPIDDDQYRLIGETYVHGYMHGEALGGSELVFRDIGLV
ncbi:hypothetical protein LTR86_001016 [Recurvomyces mirabilis]|nr:hypothetical protein LTR86_001016 [Recurvomyces mirabilis]